MKLILRIRSRLIISDPIGSGSGSTTPMYRYSVFEKMSILFRDTSCNKIWFFFSPPPLLSPPYYGIHFEFQLGRECKWDLILHCVCTQALSIFSKWVSSFQVCRYCRVCIKLDNSLFAIITILKFLEHSCVCSNFLPNNFRLIRIPVFATISCQPNWHS